MSGVIDSFHASVASILESVGLKKVEKKFFILLCRVVVNFIQSIGYDTRRLTENANRTISNLVDIKYALMLKNINVYDVQYVLGRHCASVKIPDDIPKPVTKTFNSGVYVYDDVMCNLFKLNGPNNSPTVPIVPFPEPYTMMSSACFRPGKLTAEEMRKQSAERARQLEEAYARILLAQVSDDRAPISLFTGNTEFMLPVVPIQSKVYLEALLKGSGFEINKINKENIILSNLNRPGAHNQIDLTEDNESDSHQIDLTCMDDAGNNHHYTDQYHNSNNSEQNHQLQTIFMKKPSFPQL